jgi:hypothetical protein
MVKASSEGLTKSAFEVQEFLKLLARIARRLTPESGRPHHGRENGGRTCE